MTIEVPGYIEQRIRRLVPADSFIVPGSTPVVSFGNAQTATVATLGLNPSRAEFFQSGRELVGPARRLATHASLNTSDLFGAPFDKIVQVLEDCNGYFQRNPYRWFDQLEPILNACGASYFDGTACHLDLVQWATDPTWSSLRPTTLQERLLADDLPFLIEQLRTEQLRLLLVNGRRVLSELEQSVEANFEEVDQILGLSCQEPRLYTGVIFDRVRVVAWTTNLQSSPGVTNDLRYELAEQVGGLAD